MGGKTESGKQVQVIWWIHRLCQHEAVARDGEYVVCAWRERGLAKKGWVPLQMEDLKHCPLWESCREVNARLVLDCKCRTFGWDTVTLDVLVLVLLTDARAARPAESLSSCTVTCFHREVVTSCSLYRRHVYRNSTQDHRACIERDVGTQWQKNLIIDTSGP